MARIRLRVVGALQVAEANREEMLDAQDISEIIHRVEEKYPRDNYFSFNVFLNGISVDEKTKKALADGDEVVVVPVMVGG